MLVHIANAQSLPAVFSQVSLLHNVSEGPIPDPQGALALRQHLSLRFML